MIWLFYGFLFAFAVYAIMRWYGQTPYKQVRRALGGLIVVALVFLILGVVIAALRGNIGFLPILLLVIPALMRITLQLKADETQPKQQATGAVMTKKEAFEVLNLKEGASEIDIKKAYKDLMKKVHPDHGGNDWLASQLNEAKRVLLDKN